MVDKNKAAVAQINAAFAEGHNEKFLSFCTEDVEWTMVGEAPVRGKDAIRKWMGSMQGEPPKFTVDNVIAEGDFVTAHGQMTMKEKDGSIGSYAYCDVYRFRGDKVAQLTAFVMKTQAQGQAT